MPKILDPATISADDANKLIDFFQSQSDAGVRFWGEKDTFTFADGTEFAFAMAVVQRNRKEGKPGVRYEFISANKLGSGFFGKVHDVAGTLSIESGVFRYKAAGYNGKARVVKIQDHNETYKPVSRVMNEYEIAKRAPHLAMKEPTIHDCYSFCVMRKMAGPQLFQLIVDDYAGKSVLTFNQRLELSKVLLESLKTQVTDKGIIHRDLKGDNILVESDQHFTAKIIDYGLSTFTHIPDNSLLGDPRYKAPERWDKKNIQTVKADVFSLGRILALVWRIKTDSYLIKDVSLLLGILEKIDLSSLFTGFEDITLLDKANIQNILYGMMHRDVKSRYSVEKAIECFNLIKPHEKILTKISAAPQPVPKGNSIFKKVNNGVKGAPYSSYFDESYALNNDNAVSSNLTPGYY